MCRILNYIAEFIFIATPILTFPQVGRNINFPPLGGIEKGSVCLNFSDQNNNLQYLI